ncbi:L-aspartate oxidase [Agromyces sp. Marseille-P2726]|uniref:L-aspartate oxidase n=1 Tax=Agromyces sp. Marseille-P2726 TaxID=2709132 RepID=UPI0015715B8C|nr:L-aspartate oxidase [Agromyces sp. Marseille-P2726]
MARVLVVGGGIAGLWTAVRAAGAGHEVEVVTKTELVDGSTRHAQGGIAAALFPGDSVDRHLADTLAAGAGLCDPAAVRVLCEEGPARVRDLIRFGVAFDRGESGLERGLEAAHSRARILHAGGDSTGAAIEAALVATVRNRAVGVQEHTMLLDLVIEAGRVVGARLLAPSGPVEMPADAVVLATGGSGCLYRHTTNPDVATGDGVAAAWRAGAAVADLEFIQFHPTALAAPGTPLISEAVRGEGAVLVDERGERFMLEVDARAELAPRDIVARAVWRRMAEQGGRPVRLDATALGADFLSERFPTLDAACRAAGYDWSSAPVPITPAAHYAMGGVVTDLDGRTTLPGLFAVGEAARTGVHGANRLASNSLLEAAVFADRAARALGDPVRSSSGAAAVDAHRDVGSVLEHRSTDLDTRPALPGATRPPNVSFVDRGELQTLMWEHAGLERSAEGLAAASDRLAGWRAPAVVDRRNAEDRNLLDLARLTVAAAIARRSSVGAHYRIDDPHDAVTRPLGPSAVTTPALEEAA